MKNITIALILSLALFAGCSTMESIFEPAGPADQVVQTTKEIATDVEEWAANPETGYLPEPARSGILAAASAVLLAAGAYQTWREKQQKKKNEKDLLITKSIVEGIEAAGTDGENVKPEIAKKMKANKIYGEGKILVDSLK